MEEDLKEKEVVESTTDTTNSTSEGKSGLSVTSMILGIVALALIIIPFPASALLSLGCGILAIIFGNMGKKVEQKVSFAKAGFIMGIIAVSIDAALFLFGVLIGAAIFSAVL